MAVKGIGASFKLEDGASPSTLTDISTYLDNIQGTSDVDKLDATTFQPNVASPLKSEIAGFRTRGFTLTGKWTAAAETFFSAVEGAEGINYEFGPEGTTTGKTKISGTCNVLNYSGPQASIDSIETFTCEISVVTRVVGTY